MLEQKNGRGRRWWARKRSWRGILLTVSVLSALAVGSGVSAAARQQSNQHACFGQAVRSLATTIHFGELMHWEAQNDTVPLAGPGASAETHYYQQCQDAAA